MRAVFMYEVFGHLVKLFQSTQFHFAALRIESHANCSFDFVEVWDGTRRVAANSRLGRDDP